MPVAPLAAAQHVPPGDARHTRVAMSARRDHKYPGYQNRGTSKPA